MPSPFLQQDIEDYEQSAQRYNRTMARWEATTKDSKGQDLGVLRGHVSLSDAKRAGDADGFGAYHPDARTQVGGGVLSYFTKGISRPFSKQIDKVMEPATRDQITRADKIGGVTMATGVDPAGSASSGKYDHREVAAAAADPIGSALGFHKRHSSPPPDLRPEARGVTWAKDADGNDITILHNTDKVGEIPTFNERDPTEGLTVNQIKELQSPKAKAPGLIARMLKS